MNIIGERIRQRREELGMTQAELAERLGYRSRSSINKIENGTNDITQSKVKRFAEVLDTSISYLMGWEGKPEVLMMGIESIKEKANTAFAIETLELTKQDMELLQVYHKLNTIGKAEAIKRITELSEIPRYTKDIELQNEKVM